ncbi:MAG: RlmE family RNA methyltransferase [Thaumarchaeota archaeon]|nr:RlmE family RNA methyltransferase [Nitrososphaerota archaeon]
MRLAEARTDYYRRKAREEGYKSRAAYKLLEAVKKYRLIKPGDRVLDIGAAPGGWLQVASEAVGESGRVVGIDLDEVRLNLLNVRTLMMDVYDKTTLEKLRALFEVPADVKPADVMLSDLSPKISGAWDLDHYKQVELLLRSFDLGDDILRKGGNAMLKLFDGERFIESRKEAERRYATVVVMKPKASRGASSEMYFVCLGKLT